MTLKTFNKRFFTGLRTMSRLGVTKAFGVWAKSLTAASIYHFNWRGQKIHIRKNSSDFGVFQQVHVYGHYDSIIFKQMKVNTIVDLGSNTGITVLHFKSRFPQAKIIAVEPARDNYEMLLKNVSGYSDIHCLNKAIWSSNKELNLFANKKGEASYMVKDGNPRDQAITKVSSVTMDDIVEKYNLSEIDILKIDIECSERELFSAGYESWLPKVRCIVIELHDWIQPGCAYSFFNAINHFKYNFYYLGENVIIVFDKQEQHTDFSEHPTKSVANNE